MDYTLKVKDFSDSFGAINVTIDDQEMMQKCLDGFTHKYDVFWIAITTRENPLSFFKLQSMLMFELKNTTLMGRCYIHMKILIKVMAIEIGEC